MKESKTYFKNGNVKTIEKFYSNYLDNRRTYLENGALKLIECFNYEGLIVFSIEYNEMCSAEKVKHYDNGVLLDMEIYGVLGSLKSISYYKRGTILDCIVRYNPEGEIELVDYFDKNRNLIKREFRGKSGDIETTYFEN